MKTTKPPASKPKPKPKAKAKPKPQPRPKPKPKQTGSKNGSNSKVGSGSSTTSKNGNSAFTKDPEPGSKKAEDKAKDKAESFQNAFLDSWGDQDKDANTDKAGDTKSDKSSESKGEKSPENQDETKSAKSGESKGEKSPENQDETKSAKSGESKSEKTPESKGDQKPKTDEGKKPAPNSPEGLADQFSQSFQDMAQNDPDALDGILKQSFDQASPEQLTKLREAAANGDISLPENVSFVDPSKLNGAKAGYSADDNGTVLLSETLKSNPEELRRAYTEEVGHHLDSQFGSKDSTGDEGQLFQEGLEKGQAVSADRASELKAENDKGTAEINGQQKSVENREGDRPVMGPLTPAQQRAQDAQEMKKTVAALTGSDRDAAYAAARDILRESGRSPEALQKLMAGYDGADPHVQDYMLRGVQQLADYAKKGGASREELMKASQGFFRHAMDAPQRLQERLATNPLGRVRIQGQLPPGFNAHSAQGVMMMAAQGKTGELAGYAEHLKYSKTEMTDHTNSFRDPKVGPALNDATKQVYDDLQKMPSSLRLAEKAAKGLEGTFTPDQMSGYLDQAKSDARRGDARGQQASSALARNVDQLSSRDIMRLSHNDTVRKAALEPGSESRERLMKEAVEGDNPRLKSWLTDQFKSQSMSDDRFADMNKEVGQKFNKKVTDAMMKDPKDLRGREHLFAEYGNMMRAKQMFLSGGDYSEQVDSSQVYKRIANAERQLSPDVLEIQKSLGSRVSVHKQEKFLAGQDFQDYLKLTDPSKRAEVARAELQKLNSFNPEAAQALAPKLEEQLGAMQVAEPSNGLAIFQGQSQETQGQVVDGLLEATKKGLSATGGTAKSYTSAVKALDGVATRQIAHILDNMSPDQIGNTAELGERFQHGIDNVRNRLQAVINRGGSDAAEARKALGSLAKVSQWTNQVGEIGGWGALGATLGTVSLGLGGLPQTKMEAAGAATGVAGIMGNLEDTAKLGTTASRALAQKLFNAGGKFDELAKLRSVKGVSSVLGKLKIMGPVSDIAGGALDTYGAYQEAGKGDVHGTIGKSISAAGGLGAGAGGVLLAAGLLSNPVGWTIIGVGTAASIGGMIYQGVWGMDEQEEFLQRVGVRRDDW